MGTQLSAGPDLDRLVHEKIHSRAPDPFETVPAYSSEWGAAGVALEWLSHRTRYLQVVHTYDGLWLVKEHHSVGGWDEFEEGAARAGTGPEAIARFIAAEGERQ